MAITPDVFEAYLQCPTKSWLRVAGEPVSNASYPAWVKAQNQSYRVAETERLFAVSPKGEALCSPNIEKVSKWKLATSLAVQVKIDSCVLESVIHAVERLPAEGRGKQTQFIPIRFVVNNKLRKSDKMLLAFDALVLSKLLKRKVSHGKIIYGDDHTTLRLNTLGTAGEVGKAIAT